LAPLASLRVPERRAAAFPDAIGHHLDSFEDLLLFRGDLLAADVIPLGSDE
jgi:hypothetical protein